MSYISTLWGDPVTEIVLFFLAGAGVYFMAWLIVKRALAYLKRQRISQQPRVVQFVPNTPLNADSHHK